MKKAIATLLALLGIHQHLSAEQKQDIASAAIQAAPGAGAATGATYGSLPAADWLVLFSVLFIILQGAYLVWKWRRDYRRDQLRQKMSQRAYAASQRDETDWGAP